MEGGREGEMGRERALKAGSRGTVTWQLLYMCTYLSESCSWNGSTSQWIKVLKMLWNSNPIAEHMLLKSFDQTDRFLCSGRLWGVLGGELRVGGTLIAATGGICRLAAAEERNTCCSVQNCDRAPTINCLEGEEHSRGFPTLKVDSLTRIYIENRPEVLECVWFPVWGNRMSQCHGASDYY